LKAVELIYGVWSLIVSVFWERWRSPACFEARCFEDWSSREPHPFM